jgi:hypothetical protein
MNANKARTKSASAPRSSKRTRKPSKRRTAPKEPALLARARAELTAHWKMHPPTSLMSRAPMPEAEREARIHDHARADAMYGTGVGLAVARACALACNLRDALAELREKYPDDDAMVAAARAAILEAGLTLPGPNDHGDRPERLRGLSDEARGWEFVANQAVNSLLGFVPEAAVMECQAA